MRVVTGARVTTQGCTTVAPSRGRVRATVAMHYTYEGDDAAEPEPDSAAWASRAGGGDRARLTKVNRPSFPGAPVASIAAVGAREILDRWQAEKAAAAS